MKPGLVVEEIETELGSLTTEDGTALFVCNPPVGYAFTETVFTSKEQAIAAGITEADDASNSYLLYEHIKDFFAKAPGVELHILRVPAATTFVNLFTDGNANNVLLQNYLASKQGSIKQIGVSLVPATESHTTSISSDVETAIPLAHAFAQAEYTRLRPVEVFFEGRKFGGTSSAAVDLRAKASGSVAVVVSRNKVRAEDLGSFAANYAQIGLLMGTVASIHVGRNIGRVKNGALPVIEESSFSGGQIPYVDFDDADLNVLSNKGYIYMDKYVGKTGWFWVDDHTCTAENRSDAYIYLNRCLNKATRIVIRTYIEEIKDEVLVNKTTGKLAPIRIQTYKNMLEKAIKDEMIQNPDPTRAQEIVSATVKIDPNQNVLSTSKIVVKLEILPLGIARVIQTQVSLVNPAN